MASSLGWQPRYSCFSLSRFLWKLHKCDKVKKPIKPADSTIEIKAWNVIRVAYSVTVLLVLGPCRSCYNHLYITNYSCKSVRELLNCSFANCECVFLWLQTQLFCTLNLTIMVACWSKRTTSVVLLKWEPNVCWGKVVSCFSIEKFVW